MRKASWARRADGGTLPPKTRRPQNAGFFYCAPGMARCAQAQPAWLWWPRWWPGGERPLHTRQGEVLARGKGHWLLNPCIPIAPRGRLKQVSQFHGRLRLVEWRVHDEFHVWMIGNGQAGVFKRHATAHRVLDALVSGKGPLHVVPGPPVSELAAGFHQ